MEIKNWIYEEFPEYTEKVEGELWDNTYDEYEEYEDEE